MRITIETNEKESETAVVKAQEPVSSETFSGGMQAVEPLSATGEAGTISAERQLDKTGIDAGAAPQWLLDALQHQATAPEVSVTETASVTDGGAAPSE